jgi:hypothetical protein
MTFVWNKIKQSIIHTFTDALDRTEELTSVGRKKLEILKLEHQLDDQYAEFGKYCYRNIPKLKGQLTSSKKLDELMQQIAELEKNLKQKEKELYRIREEEGIDFDS